MNAYKEMLDGNSNVDTTFLDADPNATKFEYRFC